ncbi:MAG: hypothetical protein H6898_12560 [Rhodobacter sp.]|nr:hypothetical protein [Paracoccaceae bacterium]MCC0077387.1 hypothetical protein [Rhodobacter sp.]
MSDPQATRLTALLAQARADGSPAQFAASDLPDTVDAAYAAAFAATPADDIAGWKIGGANPWSQAVFANAELFFGALLARETVTEGASFPLDGLVAPLAEPEIMLELGAWPPRADTPVFTRMALGIEIPATVLPDDAKPRLAGQVIDRAGAGGLWVGPAEPFDGARLTSAFSARYRLNDEDWREGHSGNVFGGPLGSALLFLGQALRRGAPLRSGHWIATGGLVPATRVQPGTQITAEAAGLSLTLDLT